MSLLCFFLGIIWRMGTLTLILKWITHCQDKEKEEEELTGSAIRFYFLSSFSIVRWNLLASLRGVSAKPPPILSKFAISFPFFRTYSSIPMGT